MVRRRGDTGFSLFEASIALAVLSAVAAAVITTGSSELRYYARSHEETVAERAAASQLERLAARHEAPPVGTTTFAMGRQTVTREAPGLFRIDIEVTWKAADGGDGSARLSTLLAREERP